MPKDSPNIKCPLTSVAKKVHHFSTSDRPVASNCPCICDTAKWTFPFATGSYICCSSDFAKGRASNFQCIEYFLRSYIANIPRLSVKCGFLIPRSFQKCRPSTMNFFEFWQRRDGHLVRGDTNYWSISLMKIMDEINALPRDDRYLQRQSTCSRVQWPGYMTKRRSEQLVGQLIADEVSVIDPLTLCRTEDARTKYL